MIVVYTCILGGFDNLRPPLVKPEPGVRFICFTDNPILPDVAPWEFRPIHNAGSPSRSSRLPKILPHLILPEGTDYSIWLDGCFQLAKPATEIINSELRFEDWAAHRHPARDCMYKEAALLIREKERVPHEWPLLDGTLLADEVEVYSRMGFPADRGLTANGMIIRCHTAAVARTNEVWWSFFKDGCGRDQLSLPVAFWLTGGKINDMPHMGDIYKSAYLRFGWHAAWKDKPDNVQYRPERERIASRTERLKEICGEGGYGFRVY